MDASGYNACVECLADSDCPSAHPRCIGKPGLGGECKDCKADEDCADGVCSAQSQTCVPACMTDANCANPATPCSERHRCELKACGAATICPAHTECRNGVCLRAPCSSDAGCAGGFCVNGSCHENLGTCASQSRGS